MKRSIRTALFAVLALSAAAATSSRASAQSQTSDRSGAINVQFTISKWVDILSNTASTYDLTQGLTDGLQPGAAIGTPDGAVTREVKANTPYRLLVTGLDADGRLTFHGSAPSSTVTLDFQCQSSADQIPSSASGYSDWSCAGSEQMEPTTSSWVTLRAYSQDPTISAEALAGVYTATVYLQIEAV